jgi:hypothetical protein
MFDLSVAEELRIGRNTRETRSARSAPHRRELIEKCAKIASEPLFHANLHLRFEEPRDMAFPGENGGGLW